VPGDDYINPIEYEIFQEKAASFFRVTKTMEAALATLRDADEEISRSNFPSRELLERRAALLEDAAEWAWFFIVQREALRLPHYDELFAEYGITEEVRRKMGPKQKSIRDPQQQ
jgi:hypothetical protein